MQKLDSLTDWQKLSLDEHIELPAKKTRVVRLHVNAPYQTRLFIGPAGKKEHMFLALVEGLTTVQFTITGPHCVTADGEVNLRFREGDVEMIEDNGKETFTKIIERAPRNFDLEMIQYQAQLNAETRMKSMMAEQQRRMDAEFAKLKRDQSQGDPPATPVEPQPSTDGGAPDGDGKPSPEGSDDKGGGGE